MILPLWKQVITMEMGKRMMWRQSIVEDDFNWQPQEMWQLYVTSDHHFAKNQYLDPPRSTLIIDYEIMIQWSMMDHAGKGNQKIIPFSSHIYRVDS